jgi:hypothetical protein
MDTIGFIILRNVRCKKTNNYWINAYNNIRKYYPENWIMIVDDNSNNDFITTIDLYKTYVIKSEYPARGELLPYIYYLRNKLFDIAFIIHDSVLFNKRIEYDDIITSSYKFIWDFESNKWDNKENDMILLNALDNNDLTEFYKNHHLWQGCFGCMTIINHNFLKQVNDKYDFNKLLNVITNRDFRCSFERILACMLIKEEPNKRTLLGNIHNYCDWGYSFDEIYNYLHLPLIKFWSGR